MKLAVKTREITGKKVKNLRRQGLIPAIVYGKHIAQPVQISCVKNDLLKIYRVAGYTTPVELTGDVDQLVLIHSLQLDPISDEMITADFLAVSKTEKVRANIPLVITGESQVEKLNEGRVQLVKDTLEVEAFPQDLPSQIEIDVSKIQTVNDVIFVKDIALAKKLEGVEDPELPVVTVVVLEEENSEEGEKADTTTA